MRRTSWYTQQGVEGCSSFAAAKSACVERVGLSSCFSKAGDGARCLLAGSGVYPVIMLPPCNSLRMD